MMEGLRGKLMGPENTHHTPKGQQLSQREEEIIQTREIWLLLWVKPQKLCEASPSFLFLSFCPHTSYAIQAWEQWTEHSWAWEGSSQREISAKEQTLGQLQAGEQVIAQFWCFVLSTCSALLSYSPQDPLHLRVYAPCQEWAAGWETNSSFFPGVLSLIKHINARLLDWFPPNISR